MANKMLLPRALALGPAEIACIFATPPDPQACAQLKTEGVLTLRAPNGLWMWPHSHVCTTDVSMRALTNTLARTHLLAHVFAETMRLAALHRQDTWAWVRVSHVQAPITASASARFVCTPVPERVVSTLQTVQHTLAFDQLVRNGVCAILLCHGVLLFTPPTLEERERSRAMVHLHAQPPVRLRRGWRPVWTFGVLQPVAPLRALVLGTLVRTALQHEPNALVDVPCLRAVLREC